MLGTVLCSTVLLVVTGSSGLYAQPSGAPASGADWPTYNRDHMHNGEADNRYPDPYWNDEDYPGKVPLNQEVADEFIEEMDADFMIEKNRFQGRLAPEFSRLPAHARIAFVQDAYKIMKTSTDIEKEAEERLGAGESLPPPSR